MVSILGIATPMAAQDTSPAPEVDASPLALYLPDGFTRKMADRVATVIEAVHPVRGLPPAAGVQYRVIEPGDFRAELEALFREEFPDGYIEAEDDAFTRLGLLEPDEDLEQLILGIYESQVLAYYEPRTTTFSIVGPVDKIGAMESIVVAHEYAHALQDQAFDLEGNRIKDLDQADATLAQQALVEGDATQVMFDWAIRERALGDVLSASNDAVTPADEKLLKRMPSILRRQLEFPYLEGAAFVNAIRGRGDWAAVDEVWGSQPVSTEQVLHPELYPGEEPVEISLPDVAAAMGPDWASSYEQTFGEMQIGVWVEKGRQGKSFFANLVGRFLQPDAAAGWGGDRLVSLDGPDGAWAVIWQTDWDSEDDQREFRKAARDVIKELPGTHSATDADIAGGLSSPVLVLVADSEGTLSAVNSALGLDP